MESDLFKFNSEVVTDDLVSLFDLLSKYDFEDQLLSTENTLSSSEIKLKIESNPDSKPALSAIRSNNVDLKKQ